MVLSDELLRETRDGFLLVTFNRPEARNALTYSMYEGLADVCSSVPTDGSIKAIIVSGAGGKSFAAGTDMAQFRDFSSAQDAWNYEEKMEGILSSIETSAVPTIAAINGACTGGGAAIAARCDIRIASASLKFGFPIARTLGNCLSAGNLAVLSDLMGASRVKEMVLTARLIEAEEAKAVGIVSEVLPDELSLMTRAHELGELLGGHAPLTMRATKEALRRNRIARAVDDKDLVALCYTSADFAEGYEAFLGKRKPRWQGA